MGLTESPDEILYIVGLTPEPEYEERFNLWYDTEHVPELLACPGFLSARRYRVVHADTGAPGYLAVYRMASMAAFESEEYRALRARSAEQLSALTLEVREHRTKDLIAKYEEILRIEPTEV